MYDGSVFNACLDTVNAWAKTVDDETLAYSRPSCIYNSQFMTLPVDRTIKEYIGRILRTLKLERQEDSLLAAVNAFLAKHKDGVAIIGEVANLSRKAGGIQKLRRDLDAIVALIRKRPSKKTMPNPRPNNRFSMGPRV